MKYALFRDNQFVKFTDYIILDNPEYMYYETNFKDISAEKLTNLQNKISSTNIVQRLKFLFTGKL